MYPTKRNPTLVNGSPTSFEPKACARIRTPGTAAFGASPSGPPRSSNTDSNVRLDARRPRGPQDYDECVRPARADHGIDFRIRTSKFLEGRVAGHGWVLEPPSGTQVRPNQTAEHLEAQVHATRGRGHDDPLSGEQEWQVDEHGRRAD